MTEDKRPKKSINFKEININEAYEFQYWCIRFECTADELWAAITTVGTQVEAVAEYLDKPELASSTLH